MSFVIKKAIKILKWALAIVLSSYIILCGYFYFFQEKLIFHPNKLDKNYTFHFEQDFEGVYIQTKDNIELNGLLFKAKNSKGLIFYLHGNAGALNSWGNLAPLYTNLGYDVFFLDYRGFGKSEGDIDNQTQLFEDVQAAYDKMKKKYDEHNIIILGYSIGTCPATWLASVNNPHMLILQAPYYSLTDVIQGICPIIPQFLIRYKLETYRYITNCKMPITIFHGDDDKVINYSNSICLKSLLKPQDSLVTLTAEGHNNITDNMQYQEKMYDILSD